jgi:hypothetical protein
MLSRMSLFDTGRCGHFAAGAASIVGRVGVPRACTIVPGSRSSTMLLGIRKRIGSAAGLGVSCSSSPLHSYMVK